MSKSGQDIPRIALLSHTITISGVDTKQPTEHRPDARPHINLYMFTSLLEYDIAGVILFSCLMLPSLIPATFHDLTTMPEVSWRDW